MYKAEHMDMSKGNANPLTWEAGEACGRRLGLRVRTG